MSDSRHEKALLRERLLLQRLAIAPEQRAELSLRAANHLLHLPELAGASTVAFYAAVGSEADPSVAIEAAQKAGKRVVFPRAVAGQRVLEFAPATLDELVPGPHRTREPPALTPAVPLAEVECIIVPGVGFDALGGRLGRGAGFYDATLTAAPAGARRVGFAFAMQMVPFLPTEAHDVPMDVVVTDARVTHAASRARSASH